MVQQFSVSILDPISDRVSNHDDATGPNRQRPDRFAGSFRDKVGIHKFVTSILRGATVAERLACSPPTKAIRVQSPAGSLVIFACGIHAGRCRWSAGFLGDLPFPCPFIPELLHSHLNHPHQLSRPLREQDATLQRHFFVAQRSKIFTSGMSTEQRPNAWAGETGDPRETRGKREIPEKPRCIMRSDSHMQKSRSDQLVIKFGSPWWEVSTTSSPHQLYTTLVYVRTDVIMSACSICSVCESATRYPTQVISYDGSALTVQSTDFRQILHTISAIAGMYTYELQVAPHIIQLENPTIRNLTSGVDARNLISVTHLLYASLWYEVFWVRVPVTSVLSYDLLSRVRYAVAQWIERSPPTKIESDWIAGWSAAFSGISHFPCLFIPALLHSHLISPLSAVKVSLLTAAQASQLNSNFYYMDVDLVARRQYYCTRGSSCGCSDDCHRPLDFATWFLQQHIAITHFPAIVLYLDRRGSVYSSILTTEFYGHQQKLVSPHTVLQCSVVRGVKRGAATEGCRVCDLASSRRTRLLTQRQFSSRRARPSRFSVTPRAQLASARRRVLKMRFTRRAWPACECLTLRCLGCMLSCRTSRASLVILPTLNVKVCTRSFGKSVTSSRCHQQKKFSNKEAKRSETLTLNPCKEAVELNTRQKSKEAVELNTRQKSKEAVELSTRQKSKEAVELSTRQKSKEAVELNTRQKSKEAVEFNTRQKSKEAVELNTRQKSKTATNEFRKTPLYVDSEIIRDRTSFSVTQELQKYRVWRVVRHNSSLPLERILITLENLNQDGRFGNRTHVLLNESPLVYHSVTPRRSVLASVVTLARSGANTMVTTAAPPGRWEVYLGPFAVAALRSQTTLLGLYELASAARYRRTGAGVVEWLDCSPPTKANWVRFPTRSPGFSHVGIAPDDATGRRRVFSGVSRTPAHAFHRRCSTLNLLHPHRLSRPRVMAASWRQRLELAEQAAVSALYTYLVCGREDRVIKNTEAKQPPATRTNKMASLASNTHEVRSESTVQPIREWVHVHQRNRHAVSTPCFCLLSPGDCTTCKRVSTFGCSCGRVRNSASSDVTLALSGYGLQMRCPNLRHNSGQKFNFPNTSTWDSAMTSEGHVPQSAQPCPKRQVGIAQCRQAFRLAACGSEQGRHWSCDVSGSQEERARRACVLARHSGVLTPSLLPVFLNTNTPRSVDRPLDWRRVAASKDGTGVLGCNQTNHGSLTAGCDVSGSQGERARRACVLARHSGVLTPSLLPVFLNTNTPVRPQLLSSAARLRKLGVHFYQLYHATSPQQTLNG
ncbi:hypothetical protein PR048_020672 [Dryococelus australis]|uniref:Uncharacterized protein n=1 Tax=Dryococelus australis TaxID=614101 RepID=A0ABQ9H702_9NEOP|nr:hypothetical protein PR048_020672 [Dryococelus australis]